MLSTGLSLLFLWGALEDLQWQPDVQLRYRGAFNTSEAHFSRSRIEILSGAEGTYRDQWRGHASARLFYDPAIWPESHYSESVRKDEGYDAELRTGYVEYSSLPWKMRAGLQDVVWGEALHYFSADILHPKDFRDGFLNTLSWARRPQFGFWSSYSADKGSLEFVYFPVSRLNRYPRQGAEFAVPRTLPESLGLPAASTESLWDFSEPALGVNGGLQWGAFDAHLIATWIRDPQPHLRYQAGATEFESKSMSVLAGTMSYTTGDFLFRGESQWFFGRQLNRLQSGMLTSESVTELNHLGSVEYSGFDQMLLSFQGFWMQRLGCKSGQILNCRVFQEGVQFVWMNLPLDLEFETTFWAEAADPAAWWSTKLRRPFTDHLKAELSIEEFFGSADGSSVYADWRNQDQIILQLEYLF